MSDVFLSYAREDLGRAQRLAAALGTKGWHVWWDKKIPPGRTFDEVIQEALDGTRCVVVLWSERSTRSDWVKEEAAEGARRKILVPCLIDEVRIPLGFGRIQTAHLVNWDGDPGHPDFEQLCASIAAIIGTSPAPAKAAGMPRGEIEHDEWTSPGRGTRMGEKPLDEPSVIPAAPVPPITYPRRVGPELPLYDGQASSLAAVASGSITSAPWRRLRLPLVGVLALAILGAGYATLVGRETSGTVIPDSGGSGPGAFPTEQPKPAIPAREEPPPSGEVPDPFESGRAQIEEAKETHPESNGTDPGHEVSASSGPEVMMVGDSEADCPLEPHPGVWAVTEIAAGARIGSDMITIVGGDRADQQLYEEAPGLCAATHLACGTQVTYSDIGLCSGRREGVSDAENPPAGDCALGPEVGVWVIREVAAGTRIQSNLIALVGETKTDRQLYENAQTLCAATHLRCGMQLTYSNLGLCEDRR